MADSILAANSAAQTGRAAQDAQKLADDLDDFMTILTTQLANQDPLDPMDSSEFTSQLVQFASVEQQIATNSNLEALITAQLTSQLSGVTSYVGRYIEAETGYVQVFEGESEFGYILHEDADSTIINVSDLNGKTVFSGPGQVNAGKHGVEWDGMDLEGNLVPDGIYQITVSASDADGKPVGVTTTAVGKVTGVSYVGEQPVLLLDNQAIALNQVLTLREEAATPVTDDPITDEPGEGEGEGEAGETEGEGETGETGETEGEGETDGTGGTEGTEGEGETDGTGDTDGDGDTTNDETTS